MCELLLEVFYTINDTLKEMKELMVSMNEHLSNLTVPPNMVKWAKKLNEEGDR